MNRFIAKLLGGINAIVWVLLGIVAPLGYMSMLGRAASKDPVLFFGVILGCVVSATLLCGIVALLVRIADSLDALKAAMGQGGTPTQAVAE